MFSLIMFYPKTKLHSLSLSLPPSLSPPGRQPPKLFTPEHHQGRRLPFAQRRPVLLLLLPVPRHLFALPRGVRDDCRGLRPGWVEGRGSESLPTVGADAPAARSVQALRVRLPRQAARLVPGQLFPGSGYVISDRWIRLSLRCVSPFYLLYFFYFFQS